MRRETAFKRKKIILLSSRLVDASALEGQEGLGEESTFQRLNCSPRVLGMGGRIYLGQGVHDLGPDIERVTGRFSF